LKYFEVVITNT